MADPQERAVRFYDSHPINEQQILHDLAQDGIGHDGLTEATLQGYDQDHFGGLEASTSWPRRRILSGRATFWTCARAWAGRRATWRAGWAAG
jgi:hypothetical protein